MKAFLLAEDQIGFSRDGMMVLAPGEERARELAAKCDPRHFAASNGLNLWKSPETHCYEMGEVPSQDEGIIMKGTILIACAVEQGKIYPLMPTLSNSLRV